MEFLLTKAKPSPLRRVVPCFSGRSLMAMLYLSTRLSPMTVPTFSPMDFGASIEAHFPLCPSMNNEV